MAAETSQYMPASATAGFDANEVSTADAVSWCAAQTKSCPEICGGSSDTNTCDSADFTYSCGCSNGTSPDCTRFTSTLPYYMCEATFTQCISNHPNDAAGQQQCAANEVCGYENPADVAVATFSASSTSTTTTTTSSLVSAGTGQSSTSTTSRLSSSVHTSSSSQPLTTTSQTRTSSSKANSSQSNPSAATTTPSQLTKSSGISTGAAAGIGVGCALGILLLVALTFFGFWRRRRRTKSSSDRQTPSSFTRGDADIPGHQKSELIGDLAKSPSSGTWSADMNSKPEMITNANRHELDDTQISGTLKRPWSAGEEAELP